MAFARLEKELLGRWVAPEFLEDQDEIAELTYLCMTTVERPGNWLCEGGDDAPCSYCVEYLLIVDDENMILDADIHAVWRKKPDGTEESWLEPEQLQPAQETVIQILQEHTASAEELAVCDECGETDFVDCMTELPDGTILCDNCRDMSDWHACEYCGTLFEGALTDLGEMTAICPACRGENYLRCSVCGGWNDPGVVKYTETPDGRLICESCARR